MFTISHCSSTAIHIHKLVTSFNPCLYLFLLYPVYNLTAYILLDIFSMHSTNFTSLLQMQICSLVIFYAVQGIGQNRIKFFPFVENFQNSQSYKTLDTAKNINIFVSTNIFRCRTNLLHLWKTSFIFFCVASTIYVTFYVCYYTHQGIKFIYKTVFDVSDIPRPLGCYFCFTTKDLVYMYGDQMYRLSYNRQIYYTPM